MLREIKLKLEREPDLRQIAAAHGATVTILDCKDINESDFAFLFDISAPESKAREVMADLEARKVYREMYGVNADGRPSAGLLLGIRRKPVECKAVVDAGVFCLSCPYGTGGSQGEWRVLVKDSEQLRSLMANLESRGVMASVGGVSRVKRDTGLTARQEEILAKAISLGYFEFPRRISITGLSQKVGVKPSSLSQALRAAESKIMGAYAPEKKIN